MHILAAGTPCHPACWDQLCENLPSAFRRFPLTQIHPRALAAASAAEAAELQGRFWDMRELPFHCQKALGDDGLLSIPPRSASPSPPSTATEPARPCRGGSALMRAVPWLRRRARGPRRWSSTG